MILILTGLPGSYLPAVPTFMQWLSPDKIVHLIMFGTFSYSLLWGYRDSYIASREARKRLTIAALVLGTVYGALTEYLQYTVFVNRSGNVFDFMADTIGAVLGTLLFRVCYKKKRKQISD